MFGFIQIDIYFILWVVGLKLDELEMLRLLLVATRTNTYNCALTNMN